jgi:RNA recognition motif-containing protein
VTSPSDQPEEAGDREGWSEPGSRHRRVGIVKKLYVGNLPFSATEDELREHFGQHGEVQSVALITDRETGRPRGFGFIEMDDEGAQKAISALDGQDYGGRALRVNEARDRRCGGGGRVSLLKITSASDHRRLSRRDRNSSPPPPPVPRRRIGSRAHRIS